MEEGGDVFDGGWWMGGDEKDIARKARVATRVTVTGIGEPNNNDE